MSRQSQVPPRPTFKTERPTQATLVERRTDLLDVHRSRLGDVGRLAQAQADIGEALSTELGDLQQQGEAVEALNAPQNTGLLDGLVRRFTRRRQILERRSATEFLVERYEAVSTRLRKASAFTDELRLTSLELQAEVQQLHAELDGAQTDARASAQRILDLEAMLAAAVGADQAHLRDTLQFELRQEALNLELFETLAQMCTDHAPGARALRDTVQRLYEEMQSFVLAATSTVDAAGRRILALGAAADAPIVVSELQQSLAELQDAMVATESTLRQTRTLIAHTLPELSSQIAAEAELGHLTIDIEARALDRQQAKAAAERALAQAAWEEVEGVLDGEG
ncbi:MAG: hypothetical protein AB8H79_01585 [Myxococcota bacterium]